MNKIEILENPYCIYCKKRMIFCTRKNKICPYFRCFLCHKTVSVFKTQFNLKWMSDSVIGHKINKKNGSNTGFKGITLDINTGKYRIKIRKKDIIYQKGFDTLYNAIINYNLKAKEMYGDDAEQHDLSQVKEAILSLPK